MSRRDWWINGGRRRCRKRVSRTIRFRIAEDLVLLRAALERYSVPSYGPENKQMIEAISSLIAEREAELDRG